MVSKINLTSFEEGYKKVKGNVSEKSQFMVIENYLKISSFVRGINTFIEQVDDEASLLKRESQMDYLNMYLDSVYKEYYNTRNRLLDLLDKYPDDYMKFYNAVDISSLYIIIKKTLKEIEDEITIRRIKRNEAKVSKKDIQNLIKAYPEKFL